MNVRQFVFVVSLAGSVVLLVGVATLLIAATLQHTGDAIFTLVVSALSMFVVAAILGIVASLTHMTKYEREYIRKGNGEFS